MHDTLPKVVDMFNVFSVLLFPVAVAVALVALVVVICLSVLFTPIFIFLILPFLVIAKCRYLD
jgi:hypothetical protein